MHCFAIMSTFRSSPVFCNWQGRELRAEERRKNLLYPSRLQTRLRHQALRALTVQLPKLRGRWLAGCEVERG